MNVANIETVMYNETDEKREPFEFIKSLVPPADLPEREPAGKGRLPILFDMLMLWCSCREGMLFVTGMNRKRSKQTERAMKLHPFGVNVWIHVSQEPSGNPKLQHCYRSFA